MVACKGGAPPATAEATVLRIGFGSTRGENTQIGLRQQLSLMEREALLSFGRDGHPQSWLADHWTTTADGLSLRLHLRPNVKFHDGTALTAETLARFLRKQLPDYL